MPWLWLRCCLHLGGRSFFLCFLTSFPWQTNRETKPSFNSEPGNAPKMSGVGRKFLTQIAIKNKSVLPQKRHACVHMTSERCAKAVPEVIGWNLDFSMFLLEESGRVLVAKFSWQFSPGPRTKKACHLSPKLHHILNTEAHNKQRNFREGGNRDLVMGF